MEDGVSSWPASSHLSKLCRAHFQCELSVVPLQVRGNHASAAATLGCGESSWFMPVTLPVRRVSGGSVRACGNSTTRPRVAGGRPWAAAGCSALRACCWARRIAAGVTPRVAATSGMDSPASISNWTISRSGLGNVAISAGAQCPASTRRWLCPRKSVVAASAGSTGERTGGGATDALPRAPPGSDSGCRPLEPVELGFTGVCAHQPTSARHAGRNALGHLGDIGGTSARRATSDVATVLHSGMTTPNGRCSARVAGLSWRRGLGRVRRTVAGLVD